MCPHADGTKWLTRYFLNFPTFAPVLLPFPARAWLYLTTCYLLLKDGLKCPQGISTPPFPNTENYSLARTPISLHVYLSFCILLLPAYIIIACLFPKCSGKCLCFTSPVPPTIPCPQRLNKHFTNDVYGFCWWAKTKRWLKECCKLMLRMYLHNTFEQAILWGFLQLGKYCAQVGGRGWGGNSFLISLLDHCYL